MDNLEIIEALLLHALPTSRARHALDSYTPKLVAAGEAVDELRRERVGAEDDELG